MRRALLAAPMVLVLLACGRPAEPVLPGPASLDATVRGRTLQYSPAREFSLRADTVAEGGIRFEIVVRR